MRINYGSIVEVNKNMTYTNVKGKNYAEVAQRVQAFRSIIPDGFITTEIIAQEPGVVFMKADVGYYEEGRRIVLASGMAFERQEASNLNKTSYIENCETSAVGRALGFIGIGSENSIASAEEVKHAIETQDAMESGKLTDPTKKQAAPAKAPVKAEVSVSKTLPGATPPQNAVLTYLANERKHLREAREITDAQNAELWNKQVSVLKGAGLVPNKSLSTYTQAEAERLVAFMYSRFAPDGTELLPNEGKTA